MGIITNWWHSNEDRTRTYFISLWAHQGNIQTQISFFSINLFEDLINLFSCLIVTSFSDIKFVTVYTGQYVYWPLYSVPRAWMWIKLSWLLNKATATHFSYVKLFSVYLKSEKLQLINCYPMIGWRIRRPFIKNILLSAENIQLALACKDDTNSNEI